MKLYLKYSILTVLSLLFLVACEDADPAAGGDTTNQRDFTIADYVIAGNNSQLGAFNTLYDALEKAELLDALASGSFTLLAPTDAAFAAAGINVATTSAADLAVILNYHLVPSALATLPEGRTTTVNGKTIFVKGTSLNGAATATKNITVQNGVVYALDMVLIPYAGDLAAVMAADDNLSLALSAFTKAGISLTGATARTIFVPNNDAMEAEGFDAAGILATDAAELEFYLSYHVIEADLFGSSFTTTKYATLAGALVDVPALVITAGSPVEANGVEVLSGDRAASNGVIHVMDEVLARPITMLDGLSTSAIYGGNTGIILTGLYNGMLRVGLDQTYFADLTKTYSVIGPCCGSFNEVNYPVDADLIAAIEAHIIEGNSNWITLASVGGTRFESVGGDKYVSTSSGNGRFVNGNFGNAFGPASTGGATAVYNGTFTNIVDYEIIDSFAGALKGLPEESITDLLDGDADFDLFSAALKLLEVTATGDFTVLAIDNVVFDDYFGYSTVAEVEAADPDEFASLLNHVIPKWYFGIDLDDGTLPVLSAVSAEALTFTYTDAGDIAVLMSPSDLSYLPTIVAVDYVVASNGVVHVIDDLIEF
jgi:uncharacterized surface protein with fasciclin (FAS1) repeats